MFEDSWAIVSNKAGSTKLFNSVTAQTNCGLYAIKKFFPKIYSLPTEMSIKVHKWWYHLFYI